MFYSKNYNILVIGIPKTGSTAVQKAMFEFEPVGENHTITIGERKFRGHEFAQGVLGHARAREIKEGIGEDAFNNLNTVAFIRHPLSKLVSAYHHNKRVSLLSFVSIKGKKNNLKRKVNHFLTALLPKMLPFQVWCLIYPYRTNLGYVLDHDGTRIVKFIGRTEHLESDLNKIMQQIGIDPSRVNLQKINTTEHKEWNYYFSNKLFTKLITRKVKADLDFYNKIAEEMDNSTTNEQQPTSN